MIPFIYAQAAAAGGAGGAGSMVQLMIPMVGVIAIMYFMTIGPQRKKDKEIADMRSGLSKGDSVVTIGGICGTVVSVTEQHVVIEVDKNTTLKVVKNGIGSVTKPAKD